MGIFGNKLSSLGSGLKDSLAEAKSKVVAAVELMEMPTALSELADKAIPQYRLSRDRCRRCPTSRGCAEE